MGGQAAGARGGEIQQDRAAWHPEPLQPLHDAGCEADAGWASWRRLSVPRPLFQVAGYDRPHACIACSCRSRLQPLDWARPPPALYKKSLSLQLALVLG